MEIENKAFEKFRGRQDEVVGTLLELLRLINDAERTIFERDSQLHERLLKKEISGEEFSLISKDIWNDYREEVKAIVEPRCTEKLLKKGYARSFSNTPMYGYIEDDCRGVFSMETAKKAVVEFRFTDHSTVNFMHRFTLVPSGGRWFVDAFSYGTEKEGVWHRGHI